MISVSDAEEEPDRHLSVHAPALVVTHLEGTSDKEEEENGIECRK